jgi:hypothetical protein
MKVKTTTNISAEVVAMSQNYETGTTLTTFRIKCPKFILAEVNTHRALSRSFSSSRAIPAKVVRRNVLRDPVIPVYFGKNQSGMQSKQELSGLRLWLAKQTWLLARYPACAFHWLGEKIGLHKQICNRIVEPWMWAEGVISGTDWENFYNLRCHEDAQPEFRALAVAMRSAQLQGSPRVYKLGLVHLPFVLDSEWPDYPVETLKRVSAARCARVSYYLKDGKKSDVESDLKLCDRLFGSNPKHLSPAEHVATADLPGKYGNFRDWKQFRQEIE